MMRHFGDKLSVLGPGQSPFVIGRSWIAQRNSDVTTRVLVELG